MVEPAMRHLDHPAAGRVAVGVPRRGQRLLGAALRRDVRLVAARDRGLAAGVVVVAAVQAQVPLDQRCELGLRQRVGEDLRVQQVV